ncbi:hypothetical protein TNCV_4886291 [Trichonephila clavipes]|uniref:Uncharacterized protein n=1 Tax=Trichonephila clavipes TaxID=2585209 RepID=A0A8X6V5Y5_TRICX|nr:hypothetical protein TNCV_4886291 [Trichonephila clavipes]
MRFVIEKEFSEGLCVALIFSRSAWKAMLNRRRRMQDSREKRNKDSNIEACKNRSLRRPGVEPGSTAWKAAMLTVIPPSLREKRNTRPIQTKWNAFCNRKRIFGRIVCRPNIFAKCVGCRIVGFKYRSLRRPGVEPGSTAWKAAMLTVIPPSLREKRNTRPIQTKCNAFCNRKRILGRIVCRPNIFAKCVGCRIVGFKYRSLRRPGVETGSTAWKAASYANRYTTDASGETKHVSYSNKMQCVL